MAPKGPVRTGMCENNFVEVFWWFEKKGRGGGWGCLMMMLR